MTKLLIVEDHPKTADALGIGLRLEGYDVVVALSGEEAESLLSNDAFDGVVLDWMLPGRDGIEILGALRARGSRVPVLLLTARDAVLDRVIGLDAGSDDYLVKPFAFAELCARLRVLLRRSGDRETLTRQVADLTIDIEHRVARRGQRTITLTPREFDLLTLLARHAGHAVSREMIASEVWREVRRATPLDNVIDVHIAHLRRKIDEGQEPRLLHTVRGVGFLLAVSS